MEKFQFADLHCHPTLKSYGKSFSKLNKKRTIWSQNKPNFLSKFLNRLTGITKFSQSDFLTMARGHVKIAFVSLYPFEKGFFTHPFFHNKIVALISSFITSIGYRRVRNIQKHTNYFNDLLSEFKFLNLSKREYLYEDKRYSWKYFYSTEDEVISAKYDNEMIVVPTIEGAHVFNAGLSEYGRKTNEVEIFRNIQIIKNLPFPLIFITFAHNFNNDLCGHAPSLECLGSSVNQSINLNNGFSELGYKVLHSLLDQSNGKRIYIDIKHMSLKSRLQYYTVLETDYINTIPIIVSHGAVTGRNFEGISTSSLGANFFANDSINFYDEELIKIAKSNGVFALQFDTKRLLSKKAYKKLPTAIKRATMLRQSSKIIWNQLQHVAEVLDSKHLAAWNVCCIGSDFDGTINPLNGIWTTLDFNDMAKELVCHANSYLSNFNPLQLDQNRTISAERVVANFTIHNIQKFLEKR